MINSILEGIQVAGGEITGVSFEFMNSMGSAIVQKTIILYEDNDQQEKILTDLFRLLAICSVCFMMVTMFQYKRNDFIIQGFAAEKHNTEKYHI